MDRKTWPEREWVAGVLLSVHVIVPAVFLAAGEFAAHAPGAPIGWDGRSTGARALPVLLYAQLCYAAALIALMRGWRALAVGFALLLLPVSAACYFSAYMQVTGIYF